MKPFVRIRPIGPPKRSAKESVLAAWRGVDATPIAIARADNSKAVGALVNQTLSRLGLDRRRAEAEIGKVWNSLIDPTLTAHAQPTGVRKGTLFVSVDSPVWHCEIVRYRRKEILDRMQNSFGREMIQRISFRIG
ncbi:MAG TPA: DUF721 domain-containing protein [Verrucomicrobiae bacterium]